MSQSQNQQGKSGIVRMTFPPMSPEFIEGFCARQGVACRNGLAAKFGIPLEQQLRMEQAQLPFPPQS